MILCVSQTGAVMRMAPFCGGLARVYHLCVCVGGAWPECTTCVCVCGGGLTRVYHLCVGGGPGPSVPLVCV